MRRLFLIAMVVGMPALVTWLLYIGSIWLLAVTQRTIDPAVLTYAAAVEFAAVTFIAILEARARWSQEEEV